MNSFRLTCAVVAAIGLVADHAAAVGRWNMPSRAIQYSAYGNGPGYHAPILLGPALHAPVANPGVQRLPAPLQAPCLPGGGCWQPEPSFRAPPGDMYHPTVLGHSLFAAPSLTEPVMEPTPQRQLRPTEPASPSDQPAAEAIPLPSGNDPGDNNPSDNDRSAGPSRPLRGWRW